MAVQSTLYPVLLMPIKLETRFVETSNGLQLWVRIFPDTIFLNTFNQRFSVAEIADRERFDAANFEANLPTDATVASKESLWRELVHKYGVYRAKWIIHAPNPATAATTEEEEFIFEWLPSSFDVTIYDRTGQLIATKSTQINDEKLYALAGEKSPADADAWIFNFAQDVDTHNAIDAGMGLIFDVNPDELPTKIIAVGIKDTATDESTASFSTLLQQHDHTYGFAVLDHGTPTNNTETQKSGYNSWEEYDALGSFNYAVKGNDLGHNIFTRIPTPIFSEDVAEQNAFATSFEEVRNLASGIAYNFPDHAEKLANSLGLDQTSFTYVQRAGDRNHPLFQLIQDALWFALGGQSLDLLLGDYISPEDHLWLWDHYRDFVRPLGDLPAIRIDDQPYCILPTTLVEDFPSEDFVHHGGDRLARLYQLISWSKQKMAAAVANPNFSPPRKTHEGTQDMDLFRIMTALPTSQQFQIRVFGTPRIQGYISPFLQKKANIPLPLESLSPALAIDLLRRRGETIDGELTSDWLENVAQFFREEDGSYSPLFSPEVINALEDSHQVVSRPLSGLHQLSPAKEETAAGIKVDLVPDQPNWYLGDFFQFVKTISNTSNQAAISEDLIANFQTDKPSVLTDLLYRSYSNAASLFNREVNYSPSQADLEQMQNGDQLTVAKIYAAEGEEVEAGQTILSIHLTKSGGGNNVEFLVKAPFKGSLSQFKIKTGSKITHGGQPLFHLTNQAADQSIKTKMQQIFSGIIIASASFSEPTQGLDVLRQAFVSAYDANAYRLDAWASSLANRNLTELREHRPEGLYYGAYGYLEDLAYGVNSIAREATLEDNNVAIGGFIHAPSPAQSVTAAVMKNAFINQLELGESINPFSLKLTSERIQKSRRLLDGVRQDQPIEALLGYQLERQLHDHQLDVVIHELRRIFPLEVNLSELGTEQVPLTNMAVIDGLKILEFSEANHLSPAQRRVNFADELGRRTAPPIGKHRITRNEAFRIYQFVLDLEDGLDGSLDTLFYESAYHTINGNMARAAAAMDAYKGAVVPPEISSLRTNIPSTSLTHRLALIVDKSDGFPQESIRAFLEPRLENWLQAQLGPQGKVMIHVQLENIQSGQISIKSLPLADLNLSYSDLFYGASAPVDDGDGPIENAIWHHLVQSEDITQQRVKILVQQDGGDKLANLGDFLTMIRSAYRFWTQTSTLFSEDVFSNENFIEAEWTSAAKFLENQLAPILLLLADRENEQVKNVLGEYFNQNPENWHQRLSAPVVITYLHTLNLEAHPYPSSVPTAENLLAMKRELDQRVNKALAYIQQFKSVIGVAATSEVTFKTAFGYLQQAAKSLLGKDFIVLPPVHLDASISQAINSDERQEELVGNQPEGRQFWGQERIQEWVQQLAAVEKNVRSFEDWLLLCQVWQERLEIPQNGQYKIVQDTENINYPWIGLSTEEIDARFNRHQNLTRLEEGEYYPDGGESLVMYQSFADQLPDNAPIYGLLIEAFYEDIPQREVTTGVSFEYDAPNSEAPQALLLVTPTPAKTPRPGTGGGYRWEEEDLRSAVLDTIELAKIRMLEPGGTPLLNNLLPLAQWNNLPKTD